MSLFDTSTISHIPGGNQMDLSNPTIINQRPAPSEQDQTLRSDFLGNVASFFGGGGGRTVLSEEEKKNIEQDKEELKRGDLENNMNAFAG